ncbi:tyrosine phosphatase -like [Oryza sativa Japonica Group]|uniref:Very-long-chain (3R)-3-hydroxyacyl-CoA dehydratase n=1 Tax=Oryza sativa subsp. japonica TaxID=39947 RepID=Q5ZEI6_ORYSJ|nr:tyrosine phosphatase -like [Oryza sativa Japonica Group]
MAGDRHHISCSSHEAGRGASHRIWCVLLGGQIMHKFICPEFLMVCSAMAADGSMVRRLYLSIYNWVAFIGWAQVLCYMTLALLDKGHEAVYAAIERPLLFTQTAAILEVLTQSYIFVTSLLICWCIIEVTRYSFYGMKESFGFTPSWLLWLRYSTFIACFPVGVVSEICLAYTVLPFMKASEKYCLRMPNKWNFSFNYFYANVFFMAFYVPGKMHPLLNEVDLEAFTNCSSALGTMKPSQIVLRLFKDLE